MRAYIQISWKILLISLKKSLCTARPEGSYASPAQKRIRQGAERAIHEGTKSLDVVGIFMASRSEQVGHRNFKCELCSSSFCTVNTLRVHFERKHLAEAERWWEETGGKVAGLQ